MFVLSRQQAGAWATLTLSALKVAEEDSTLSRVAEEHLSASYCAGEHHIESLPLKAMGIQLGSSAGQSASAEHDPLQYPWLSSPTVMQSEEAQVN